MNAICLKCLDPDAVLKLDLADGNTISCESCNEEFSVIDVRRVLDGWAKLLPWLEANPVRHAPAPVVTT
jgi:hypothetical protein